MSDLFETREKVEKGAQWRGDITVAVTDQETDETERMDLTIRQLRDPEYWEVMSLVDTDEIEELQDKLPDEQLQELRELRDAEDDLDEQEEARLESLQESLEENEVNMFDILSTDTFEGIVSAAKYGVEPDASDVQRVLTQHGEEVVDQYGSGSEENARKWAQKNIIEPMIDRSTGFTSFTIGVKVLNETFGGDVGN